jgi:hypothetical protein
MGKEEKDNDRIAVPELVIEIYLTAFIGAGNIEVMIRLQKAFNSMYAIDNPAMKIAAMHHS